MNWHEWLETNELKRINSNWFVDLILKKLSKPVCVLRFLCEIELSQRSRAHFVDPIFKKWSKTVSFWWFLCEIELSPQSRAHFVDLTLKKSKQLVSIFGFLCDIELSLYTLVHMLSTTFRIKARNCGNRHPLAATTDGHFSPKNKVSCPRVFSAVNSGVPDRSHTMVWLTWWCDSWLWQSFVTRKLPN